MTETLSCGVPVTMTQNVAYACPPNLANLTCTAAGPPTFQACNEPTFAAPVGLTVFEGYVFLSGLFVRCTTASPLVVVKRY